MAVTFTQDLAWSIDPPVDQIGFTQDLAWALGVSPESVQLYLVGAPTGLVGVLTVAIVTLDGSIYVYGPTTTAIVESPAGTGRYIATIPRPDVGHYLVVWSDGVTAAPPVDLTVYGDTVVAPPLRAVVQDGRYELKAGDTESLVVQLVNNDWSPVDLTFAVEVTTNIFGPGESALSRTAAILNEEDGLVLHEWLAPAETAAVGAYRSEWEILLADGSVVTVPSMGAFQFYVTETV